MKKVHLGILLGIVAGIIDVVPMIFQGLTWDANISAFVFWVVVGFIIATSNLKLKGALKGVVISVSLMIPLAVMIAFQEPISLIPIFIFNLILGSLLGFFINKYGK